MEHSALKKAQGEDHLSECKNALKSRHAFAEYTALVNYWKCLCGFGKYQLVSWTHLDSLANPRVHSPDLSSHLSSATLQLVPQVVWYLELQVTAPGPAGRRVQWGRNWHGGVT